jgi:hypothetical protein
MLRGSCCDHRYQIGQGGGGQPAHTKASCMQPDSDTYSWDPHLSNSSLQGARSIGCDFQLSRPRLGHRGECRPCIGCRLRSSNKTIATELANECACCWPCTAMGFQDERHCSAMVSRPLDPLFVSCSTPISLCSCAEGPEASRGCSCDGNVNPPWNTFLDKCHVKASVL